MDKPRSLAPLIVAVMLPLPVRKLLHFLLLAGAVLGDPGLAVGQPPPTRKDYLGDPLPAGAVYRLGTTRLRHSGGIDLLFFSDDGKTLVAVGYETMPTAWDVETGKRISTDATKIELMDKSTGKSILVHTHPALWSAWGFKQEGQTLLAMNYENVVTAWDIETGKATRKENPDATDALDLGKNPVTKSARVYLDPLTGEEKQTTTRWSSPWYDWSLAASGKHVSLAYRSSDEAPKNEIRPKVATPFSQSVHGLRIRLDVPGRKLVVQAGWEYIGVKDLASDKMLWDREVGPPNESGRGSKQVKVECLALSPDGKVVAAATDSGHIELLDLVTGERVRGSRFHPGFFSGPVQFVPGTNLVLVPMGREAVLWDLAAGKKVRGFGNRLADELPILSPDGKSILVSEWDETAYKVTLEETTSGQKLWTLDDRNTNYREAEFSQDGQFISIRWSEQTQTCISAKTGKQVAPTDVKDSIFPSDAASKQKPASSKDRQLEATSPDGRFLAQFVKPGTQATDWHFEVRDVQSKQTVLKLESAPSRWRSMRRGNYGCFSADSKFFAYRRGDSIEFYDIESKQQLGPPRPQSAPIWDMKFAPSGNLLAVYCNDSTVTFWDAKSTSKNE